MQLYDFLLLVFAIPFKDIIAQEVETITQQNLNTSSQQRISLFASHETVDEKINKIRNWFSRLIQGNQNTQNRQLRNWESKGTDFNSLGNEFLKQRKFKEAIEYFTKEIMENPSEAMFLRNRTYAYIQLNKWNNALDDALKAVELEPANLKGHFILGLVWLGLESFNEAIDHLQKGKSRHVARELAKWQNEFCDTAEIVSTLRTAHRKRRQKQIEEEKIHKVELYTFLEKLIQNYTLRKSEEILVQIENKINDDSDKELGDKIIKLDSDHDRYINTLKSVFFKNDDKQPPKIPQYFRVRISLDLIKEPVITPSGITYDRSQIEKHLKVVGLFDPTTRKLMTDEDLIPNNAIEAAIDAFLEENDWLVESEE